MKIIKTLAVKEEAEYRADNDNAVIATSTLTINVGYPSTLYDGCTFEFHMDDAMLEKTINFLMSRVDPSTKLSDYIVNDMFGNVISCNTYSQNDII